MEPCQITSNISNSLLCRATGSCAYRAHMLQSVNRPIHTWTRQTSLHWTQSHLEVPPCFSRDFSLWFAITYLTLNLSAPNHNVSRWITCFFDNFACFYMFLLVCMCFSFFVHVSVFHLRAPSTVQERPCWSSSGKNLKNNILHKL